jgi:hypothetical protein
MPGSLLDALYAISGAITDVHDLLDAGALPQPGDFARVTDLVREALGHLVHENGEQAAQLDIGRSLAAILAAIADAYRALAVGRRDDLADALQAMRAGVADALAAYPRLKPAP